MTQNIELKKLRNVDRLKRSDSKKNVQKFKKKKQKNIIAKVDMHKKELTGQKSCSSIGYIKSMDGTLIF